MGDISVGADAYDQMEKLGDVMKKLILDVGTVFKNFRKCFGASIEQARQNYHLPKSQFLDLPQERDKPSDDSTLNAGEVFRSFVGCLSNAIEDAREGNHLPKSKFRQMADENDVAPAFLVSSGLDDSFFTDPIIEKVKLDASVLPGVSSGEVELPEAGFDGTIPEALGGRAWSGPFSTK